MMKKMQGFDFFRNFISKQYCYYRTILSEPEKRAYDKIREGLLSYFPSIFVLGMTSSQIQDIFEKIKQDNPWLFYVETAAYQYAPLCNSGSVIPKYRFTKEEVDATLQAIIRKCSSIVNGMMSNTESEKELVIHDFFCKNVYYDNDFAASSFECVGPLLFGKGVCDGISKAAKLLFDFADIEALQVCGKSSQPHHSGSFSSDLHAWNIVKVDGRYYHLDITFDLTTQAFNIIRYDYFNLSDNEIRLDHEILSSPIPKCPTSNNYYMINGLYMHSQNDYRRFLQKKSRRQKDLVFKLPCSGDIEATKKKIMAVTSEVLASPFSFLSQYQLISNDSQFVFHLHLS